MDKLKKNSRVKETNILAVKDIIPTDVPMINAALSGSIDGGMTPGLTVLAGPSKHFKTSFALIMASAYLKKYKDAVILFYDSEFGSPQSYFTQFGIDPARVLHTPIMNVEQLKDIVHQLDCVKIKLLLLLTLLVTLHPEKSVADMSRAKQLKSLFRMCPILL